MTCSLSPDPLCASPGFAPSVPPRRTPRRECDELAGRGNIEVELLLSTPQTIVVRARLEFAESVVGQDAGLVIARQHCRGDRPSGTALLAAAQQCLQRAASNALSSSRTVQRLWARIDGEWRPLLDRSRVPPHDRRSTT